MLRKGKINAEKQGEFWVSMVLVAKTAMFLTRNLLGRGVCLKFIEIAWKKPWQKQMGWRLADYQEQTARGSRQPKNVWTQLLR